MKTKYPMKSDKYYIYCPPLNNKVLEKLRSEFWKSSEDVLPYNLHQIFPTSPKPAREALEQLARNFKKESGYDFTQYTASETEGQDHLGAFLWAEDCLNNDFVDNRAIGGLCFRYRKKYYAQEDFNGWALQWVYIHPNHRRNGLLASAWDYFKTKYGDFLIEDPFSISMYFFIAKNGFPRQAQQDFYNNSPGPKGKMWRAINSIGRTESAIE